MKKIVSLLLVAILVCFGCEKYDDSALKADISSLKSRMDALERQCSILNDNIISLQTLIKTIQSKDWIVGISDLSDGSGYLIELSSGRKITLRNGTDGKDGRDGADGYTPKISIRLFSDGCYYWTIDGDWLLVDGMKVKASGKDGKDGVDGQNGKDGKDGVDGKDGIDGKDGQNGKDGITPQLKIEDGFWYITYDNGANWSKLGKAIGENGKDGSDGKDGKDGKDGENGKDGQNGDNFFESIKVEDGYLVIVVNDDDKTTIKVPMSVGEATTLRYIPEYSDGIVRVPYYKNGSTVVPLPFDMRFEVVPAASLEVVEKNWKTALSLKAVYTKIATKAAAGDFVPLEITKVSVADGVMTLNVSPVNLDPDFFNEKLAANSCLNLKDGSREVISEYIPLKPEVGEPEEPQPDYGDATVTYTTIDNAEFPFYISGLSNGTGKKYRNVYEDGVGRIVFDDNIDALSFSIPKERRNEVVSFNIVAPVRAYGDLKERFSRCSRLREVDLSKLETSGVTDMNFMFSDCSSLKNLDLSNWNLGNTTNICGMFNGCSSLKSIDISGWNTSKVTKMGSMFGDCESLKSLEVSKWDTGKVTDMHWMFNDCTSLENLSISDWNTSNVMSMTWMFSKCRSLKSLDLSKWNTQNVTTMGRMFGDCEGLESLNLSGWNTKNVTNMNAMFDGCSNLEVLDISGWNTCDVADHRYMFSGCSKLKTIYMRGCDEATIAMIESEKPAKAIIVTE